MKTLPFDCLTIIADYCDPFTQWVSLRPTSQQAYAVVMAVLDIASDEHEKRQYVNHYLEGIFKRNQEVFKRQNRYPHIKCDLLSLMAITDGSYRQELPFFGSAIQLSPGRRYVDVNLIIGLIRSRNYHKLLQQINFKYPGSTISHDFYTAVLVEATKTCDFKIFGLALVFGEIHSVRHLITIIDPYITFRSLSLREQTYIGYITVGLLAGTTVSFNFWLAKNERLFSQSRVQAIFAAGIGLGVATLLCNPQFHRMVRNSVEPTYAARRLTHNAILTKCIELLEIDTFLLKHFTLPASPSGQAIFLLEHYQQQQATRWRFFKPNTMGLVEDMLKTLRTPCYSSWPLKNCYHDALLPVKNEHSQGTQDEKLNRILMYIEYVLMPKEICENARLSESVKIPHVSVANVAH